VHQNQYGYIKSILSRPATRGLLLGHSRGTEVKEEAQKEQPKGWLLILARAGKVI
jgi:hypothetical protein